MIAFLFLKLPLIFGLLAAGLNLAPASVEPAPPVKFIVDAPHEPTPPLTDSARPTTPHYAPPAAAAPVDPGCAPGEEWQGEFGCVAVQLPEETIGRAYG